MNLFVGKKVRIKRLEEIKAPDEDTIDFVQDSMKQYCGKIAMVVALNEIDGGGYPNFSLDIDSHDPWVWADWMVEEPTTKIVKLHPDAQLPKYATSKAAGMDLRACITEAITLEPFQRGLIPTGLAIQLQDGQEAQIRPRSGLAANHGITVLNSPGTIDGDYTGEIKVILINLSNTPFVIEPQERIAQMVVADYVGVQWEKVETLEETERGAGGFGHTGKN